MKKSGSLLILCFILSLSSFLTGCKPKSDSFAETATATVSVTAPAADDTETPIPTASETTPADFTFETETYTSGAIIISYPQLTGLTDKTVQDSINGLIKDSAMRDVSVLEESANVTYEINYEVMYFGTDFFSVRFEGYSYHEGAAHPGSFLYSAILI
jgi:hypothetical protein